MLGKGWRGYIVGVHEGSANRISGYGEQESTGKRINRYGETGGSDREEGATERVNR